jgi:hypothetical protein
VYFFLANFSNLWFLTRVTAFFLCSLTCQHEQFPIILCYFVGSYELESKSLPCLLFLRNNYTAGQTMNLFDLWVLGVGYWMFYTMLLCLCNNFLLESHILFNTFCSCVFFVGFDNFTL